MHISVTPTRTATLQSTQAWRAVRSLRGVPAMRALQALRYAVAVLLLRCSGLCEHETIGLDDIDGTTLTGPLADTDGTTLLDGRAVLDNIKLNRTRLYYYENFNVTTMNQPDRYRKLVLTLEPCEGVVYLFVRNTRRCWPDPFSCCKPLPSAIQETTTSPPCDSATHSIDCGWTHLHSVIDGTRDAAPTFFEMPLSSSKYYIAVFAPYAPNVKYGIARPTFRLTALADIGAFPRPGSQGHVRAKHVSEMAVELEWDQATFMPVGVSDLRHYHVYSSRLLASESAENSAVLLNPKKVMNSVCGLERNAVRYGSKLSAASCQNGLCTAVVHGIVPRQRYMLNIISDSHRGFNSSYSGIIVSSDWTETTQVFNDNVTALVGAICGTIFGVVVIGYLSIAKLYH